MATSTMLAALTTSSATSNHEHTTPLKRLASLPEKCKPYNPTDPNNSQNQLYVQLALSLALGLTAFFGFCFLRPRWPVLYAARKKRLNNVLNGEDHRSIISYIGEDPAHLPELPNTFFGWIPVLYRITEEQVLSSAGLDAHVFLAFFKMSMKLFGTMFLLTAAILAPINKHYLDLPDLGWNSTVLYRGSHFSSSERTWAHGGATMFKDEPKNPHAPLPDTTYLWAYAVFTYVFSGLAFYFMAVETRRIIQIRQDYLGSQSTITDRTLRLSGIPQDLRDEDKIRDFLEKLEIGKVESVTVCRDWRALDDLLADRDQTLRRLEHAWTTYYNGRKDLNGKHIEPSRIRQHAPENHGNEESDSLLTGDRDGDDDGPRLTMKLRYGLFKLRYKVVDAIDCHEARLRMLDKRISVARKMKYKATPVAFVTMDSIPACQMAVQALLDPHPMQLIAKLAPAPSDINWPNTYLSRPSRMLRSWTITLFIVVLTIVWLVPVIALAGLVDICSIRQVSPSLADVLESHNILKALVQTGLPTLVVSLLNLAVPFLYDWLSSMQGMVSQGDVELSLISKNFFFTFFNVFLVFTVFQTASSFWLVLQDSLKDTTWLAFQLARSVSDLSQFYTNLILLQGVGLLPFRLLQFGSVSLYPIYKMFSHTPRDFAELKKPPIFKYGFFLPPAILIYILCMTYAILPAGYLVLLFGMVYFVAGYYTYKYQLLYSMDHPQHATGGAWPMICKRLLLGIGVFQLTIGGLIALNNAFTPAVLTAPLLPFTAWCYYYYGKKFEPLTKFIALRNIRRSSDPDVNIAGEDLGINRPPGRNRRGSTLDEVREKGLSYRNPSLVSPLQKVWLDTHSDVNGLGHDVGPNRHDEESNPSDPPILRQEGSASSSVSLGDTHIWRDEAERAD